MGRFPGRRLFLALPPEAAHRLAGTLLGMPLPWQRIGGRAPDDPRLHVTLAGIPLKNPIGLAAGFDKGCAHLGALGRLGFGYVVGGTVTRRPRRGGPKPRIVRDPAAGSMVNAMGLPNPGAEAVAKTLGRSERTAPRLVSLADEGVEEALAALGALEPLVDGFELNASSPNAGWRHETAHLAELLRTLRNRTDKPIFVKLPPFESDHGRRGVLEMAVAAHETGASGLTCSNTRPVEEPRLPSGRGGLSGRPLYARTTAIVREVRAVTGGALPINACGGIFTAADALACIEAGATTIQIYTGMIYEGPAIVGSIAGGLARALARRGEDLASLVGSANQAG